MGDALRSNFTAPVFERHVAALSEVIDSHEGQIIAVRSAPGGYKLVDCSIKHLCSTIENYNEFMDRIKQFHAGNFLENKQ